jgi:glycopeptide antibiotics resistance protein
VDRSAPADQKARIVARWIAGILLVIYLGVAAYIVFVPEGEVPTNAVHRISHLLQEYGAPGWFSPGYVEFATNVLLFVPLSMLGATLWPAWRWFDWLLVGFLVTTVVEVVQAAFLPGRSFQLSDIVANTLGTVLGYLVVATVVGLATSAKGGRSRRSKRSP